MAKNMLENREIEIWVCLSSEKESVSLCWGITYDPEGPGSDWLSDETSEESFWENYSDFEPGIDKAKQLVKLDTSLSFKQALYEVFGHFLVSYEVNGIEKDLGYNIDGDGIMYSLLVKGE